MTKLYYTATSCSAACFIAAFTAGVAIETEQVDYITHLTHSGADFYAINPKGNVPCLVLDDGTVLNENTAVLQYIADFMAVPGAIAPVNGTVARAVLHNVLSYISTEVHPSISGTFFGPAEVRSFVREKAAQKLTYLEHHLIADKPFLVGDSFTIADAYLYIVLSWTSIVDIDLTPYPKVKGYFERVGAMENVKAAHARIATNPSTTI